MVTENNSYIVKDSIKVVERFFDLPLNYDDPDGKKIRVFARQMIPLEKAKTPSEQDKLPFFVYLQGGPGFEVSLSAAAKLAPLIHEQGYQTLWLDPRGTGLSTPFSADLLFHVGSTDQEIFEYLKHFRADNIVKDCEAIRTILLSHLEDPELQKWTILGQSFGGFCALTYLSFFPEGLKEVFITGGLAPLGDQPDPVYRDLTEKIIERNEIFYKKYPSDIKRVKDILAFLDANQVELPNGGLLTPDRFLQLGIKFGSKGGIDQVHEIILRAANDLELFGQLSYNLLEHVQSQQGMDGNPIYAILHEPIYCQGQAANWSARRVLDDCPQFLWSRMKTVDDPSQPVYFTGEMVFPSMFNDYKNLRPLKGAADLIAQYDGWPRLYDLEQLARNEVKVTAATYYDDMYVEFNNAQTTAKAVKNVEQYITNQLFHGAVRTDTEDVLKALFRLSKREYD